MAPPGVTSGRASLPARMSTSRHERAPPSRRLKGLVQDAPPRSMGVVSSSPRGGPVPRSDGRDGPCLPLLPIALPAIHDRLQLAPGIPRACFEPGAQAPRHGLRRGTALRIQAQGRHDQGVELRVQAGHVAAGRLEAEEDGPRDHVVQGRVAHGVQAREDAIEQHAELPHVGRGAADLLAEGLGGQVAQRSHHEARGGEGRGVEFLGEAHQAEVEDLHHALAGEEHVRGLHVAVDQAPFVGVGQPLRRLGHDLRPVEGVEPSLLHEGREGLSLHELHRVEADASLVVEVVDADEVGVVQPGETADLALEAEGEVAVVHEVLADHLDRHAPIESLVPGQVDLAHAAASQAAENGVSPRRGRVEEDGSRGGVVDAAHGLEASTAAGPGARGPDGPGGGTRRTPSRGGGRLAWRQRAPKVIAADPHVERPLPLPGGRVPFAGML